MHRNGKDLVKQVRTPPERPADGVVGCVYESFVPGGWHRWMEKEILWFFFRRAEPDIILSFPAGRCRQYLLLHPAMPPPRDERLIYPPHPPVRWPAAADSLTR
ncbi:hypothetical protein DXA34_16210 [[Clostridium] symbiosum]|nr:hypothetical protein DXA34_16210 [[Clostridium] symbiosum]